jgi:hypothetical protein
MAARRLLIVMLVLLGISSVIAVMIPSPENRSNPEETAATGATGATGAGEPEISKGTPDSQSGPKRESVSMDVGDPVEVNAAAGSHMILTVRSREGSDVEIKGLGLADFADPYAPAVFDLILPPDPGRFAVKAPGESPSAVIVTGSGSRG